MTYVIYGGTDNDIQVTRVFDASGAGEHGPVEDSEEYHYFQGVQIMDIPGCRLVKLFPECAKRLYEAAVKEHDVRNLASKNNANAR